MRACTEYRRAGSHEIVGSPMHTDPICGSPARGINEIFFLPLDIDRNYDVAYLVVSLNLTSHTVHASMNHINFDAFGNSHIIEKLTPFRLEITEGMPF
jgi:hypothetical protein